MRGSFAPADCYDRTLKWSSSRLEVRVTETFASDFTLPAPYYPEDIFGLRFGGGT